MILNIQKAKAMDVSMIKLILAIIDKCRNMKIHIRIVGSAAQMEELKGFQETADIPVYISLEDAKASF